MMALSRGLVNAEATTETNLFDYRATCGRRIPPRIPEGLANFDSMFAYGSRRCRGRKNRGLVDRRG